MIRHSQFIAAYVAVFVLFHSSAYAACESHRLVGQWQTYIISSQSSWAACDLIVKDNGTLDNKSECVGSSFRKEKVTGNLFFNRSCDIEGRFVLQGLTFTIVHASDNIDQSKLGGIMRLPNGQFSPFLAIRE